MNPRSPDSALPRRPTPSSVPSFFLLAIALCSGCTTQSNDSLERGEKVTYYDRNHDGKVDLEKHEYRGVADADWQLRDDDYDGRYEKKILFGFAVQEWTVDIPVPTNVKIARRP